ncbi:transposable element Tcb2 transposase [Trichonephila clavipes]|nr:transposable element Tcb2 transposase [Trichonephila clavipes]
MSTVSQRSHLTDSEAWRVVGRLEGGQTQAEVARAIGVSQMLTARRHRNMNATLLQQHLRSATGTTVPTQTVRNQFHGVGLYALRPLLCVRLTSRHCRDCRERICIWRDRGSRNNPAFVHESVRFGGGGVLVYGGISIDGRTDLYIIRDGPLTARRYRDEILRTIVVPYAAAIGDDFILIDDNSRPHRANLVEDSLFEEGIVRMEWPACSPDMNPIEHVWDALGRRVTGRQPSPQTLQELERALLEEWDRIPQLVINSLIDSMPQRSLQDTIDFNSKIITVRDRGSREWYRYRIVACLVTSSSPVPLKTRRVGQQCTLNLSRAETSSRWCGVVVRRGGASSGVVHVT